VNCCSKLIGNFDVKPAVRLKDFTDRIGDVQKKALLGPCGNFSVTYKSMCDLFGVEFMEDLAWVRVHCKFIFYDCIYDSFHILLLSVIVWSSMLN
jgi:hypothetical protein